MLVYSILFDELVCCEVTSSSVSHELFGPRREGSYDKVLCYVMVCSAMLRHALYRVLFSLSD